MSGFDLVKYWNGFDDALRGPLPEGRILRLDAKRSKAATET